MTVKQTHEHQTKRSGHRRYRPAGARLRALLGRGHRVGALTRKPDSEAARRLMSAGADLVAGDLGHPASLQKATRAAGTMFLMGNSNEAGAKQETRQGIIATAVAKHAGVGHLIYSSVADANKKTAIPHFDSKYLVEKHVAGLGIPYTISAPASFMENIVAPWSIGTPRQGNQRLPDATQTRHPAYRSGGHRGLRGGVDRAA